MEEVPELFVSEEQKEIVLSRLKEIEKDPESTLDWEEIERKIRL